MFMGVSRSSISLVLTFACITNAFNPSVLPSQSRSPPSETKLSMQMDRRVDRRGILGALFVGSAALMGSGVAAEDSPIIPKDQMIPPPATSCAQGVGGKCEELAEGNPLIKELQERSAKNRLKYQKEELESYWNRNYKDFFDYSCNKFDKQCNFQQGADGKWTVTEKDTSIKLKETRSQ